MRRSPARLYASWVKTRMSSTASSTLSGPVGNPRTSSNGGWWSAWHGPCGASNAATLVQDSIAVQQVRVANRELDGLVDKSLRPYDRELHLLNTLVEAVAGEQFVSSGDDFANFNAAFSDPTEGRAAAILTQLFRLLDPKTGEGSDPDALVRDPDVPIATGAERTQACKQMKSLLRDEIKAVTEARQRDCEAGLEDNASYFRDGAIPASGPRAAVVFRMEETSFRQVARFTDLLLRLKAKEAGGGDAKKSRNEGRSHDVDDNKGSISGTHDVNENK